MTPSEQKRLPADVDAFCEDDRPWEQQGGMRRDGAPHRGNILLLLGDIALVAGLASCFLGFIAIPAVAISILTLAMAGRDLRLMRVGLVDPAGRRPTRKAWNCADLGLLLSLAGFLFWGLFLLMLFCHDLLHAP